jgi:hypothetical protein
MKTRTNQEILDNAYKAGVISEKDILLLKRRLNSHLTTNIKIKKEIKVSNEQKEKGLKWLRNLYISPTGKIRKNNPFGWREITILECSNDKLEAYLVGFFNIGNFYKLYIPMYRYTDGKNSFAYYVTGKVIRIFN